MKKNKTLEILKTIFLIALIIIGHDLLYSFFIVNLEDIFHLKEGLANFYIPFNFNWPNGNNL